MNTILIEQLVVHEDLRMIVQNSTQPIRSCPAPAQHNKARGTFSAPQHPPEPYFKLIQISAPRPLWDWKEVSKICYPGHSLSQQVCEYNEVFPTPTDSFQHREGIVHTLSALFFLFSLSAGFSGVVFGNIFLAVKNVVSVAFSHTRRSFFLLLSFRSATRKTRICARSHGIN